MVITPKIRSNICINAHPIGCAKEVEREIAYVKAQKAKRGVKAAAEGLGLLNRLRIGQPHHGRL